MNGQKPFTLLTSLTLLTILKWTVYCLTTIMALQAMAYHTKTVLSHRRGLRMLKSIFVPLILGSVCAFGSSCVKDKKEAKKEGQEEVQDAQIKVQKEQAELDEQRAKAQKDLNEKSVELQKEMNDKSVDVQKDINAEKKDVIEAQKDVEKKKIETQKEVNKAPK